MNAILIHFAYEIIKTTFQEALILSAEERKIPVKTCRIRFIIVLVLFVPPRRKLKATDDFYYAGFGEIKVKRMIALARGAMNEVTYL